MDYIKRLVMDFQEIHGDRSFGDDPAIIAGMGMLDERPVMFVAEQKGRDTKVFKRTTTESSILSIRKPKTKLNLGGDRQCVITR